MAKIHFIGGIHGAGKGTICKQVCEQSDLVYLSASELIKWNEISEIDNKKVLNIPNTQDRLLAGLNVVKKDTESYLLDGHFCLFNADGEIEMVPIETFEKIIPNSIIVVTEKVEIIKTRLEKRDNKIYEQIVLERMQDIETKHAEKIALHLNVPFLVVKDGEYKPILEVLK